MKAERVIVGRIAKPIGVRGDVVIQPTGDDPDRFAPETVLFLDPSGDESVTIRSCRVDASPGRGRGIVVSFEGRPDRTAVEELAGRSLYQDMTELPPLPEGVYYQFQLVGLRVTKADGSILGILYDITTSADTDLYEVRGDSGEWLIPSRKEFVAWIDLSRGELRLTDRVDLLEVQEKEAPPKAQRDPSSGSAS